MFTNCTKQIIQGEANHFRRVILNCVIKIMNEKELRKLIREERYKDLISYINKLSDEDQILQTVNVLKKQQVFVDKKGKKRYNKYIKRIITSHETMKKYICEVKIANELFIQERKLQNILKKYLRDEERLAAVWKQISESFYKKAESIKDGIYIAQYDIDPIINLHGYIDILNTVFKSMLYDNSIVKKDVFRYSIFRFFLKDYKLKFCSLYIEYAQFTGIWDAKYREWVNGLVSFEKKDSIMIKYINTEEISWFRNSKAKIQVYEAIKEMRIALYVKNMYPLANREELDYHIAVELVKDNLHIDSIDEEAYEIPVTYWISAYTALIQYSKKQMKDYRKLELACTKTWFLKTYFYNTKEFWVHLFKESGIPDLYANKLFDSMVYNFNSVDLYDDPFVAVKKSFTIPYFLFENASIGSILQSKFKTNEAKLSNRGKYFEKYIIDIFKSKNIPIIQLHKKVKKQEYECDLAFLLDDVLFLCECKDNGYTAILNGTQNFYKVDVQQTNRICDYFENDIPFVIDSFKKMGYEGININNIERILVYNTCFHTPIIYKGVTVVDIERLIAPIRRNYLDIEISKCCEGLSDIFCGEYSSQKLLEYIKRDLVVAKYDEITKIENIKIPIGDLIIETDMDVYTALDYDEISMIVNPAMRMAREIGIHVSYKDALRKI